MTDDEFLAAFETGTLPKPAWTHQAHVRMAWLYLTRLTVEQAVQKARVGIRAYNAAQGNQTGYHDTVTVAFVRLIASRLTAGEGLGAFLERNPDLLDRHRPPLLRHYSRDRLESAEARARFVEPDLLPLPE
ncbi:MAG: hypothetical protein U0871_08195 [Gemmataceae bacterium]